MSVKSHAFTNDRKKISTLKLEYVFVFKKYANWGMSMQNVNESAKHVV
jgi:hypothetical protein